MYDAITRQRVLAMLAAGLSIAAASRMSGVSRATIADWRSDPSQAHRPRHRCFRCLDQPPTDAVSYVYLLGMYLGDGHITDMGRSYRLRIFCADAYPRIMEEARATMTTCLPNRVSSVHTQGCTTLVAYSKHWPCLFPQHGPGLKHERPIVLEHWQESAVRSLPRQFLRGLIDSDGSRCLNNVTVRGKRYAYPRYFFTNYSQDILDLFVWACSLLGVVARQNNDHSVNVARRDDVALLDTFIGPKA